MDSLIPILPEEIWFEVFCYLKPQELARIARVCRLWNELSSISSLWKNIFYYHIPSISSDEYKLLKFNLLKKKEEQNKYFLLKNKEQNITSNSSLWKSLCKDQSSLFSRWKNVQFTQTILSLGSNLFPFVFSVTPMFSNFHHVYSINGDNKQQMDDSKFTANSTNSTLIYSQRGSVKIMTPEGLIRIPDVHFPDVTYIKPISSSLSLNSRNWLVTGGRDRFLKIMTFPTDPDVLFQNLKKVNNEFVYQDLFSSFTQNYSGYEHRGGVEFIEVLDNTLFTAGTDGNCFQWFLDTSTDSLLPNSIPLISSRTSAFNGLAVIDKNTVLCTDMDGLMIIDLRANSSSYSIPMNQISCLQSFHSSSTSGLLSPIYLNQSFDFVLGHKTGELSLWSMRDALSFRSSGSGLSFVSKQNGPIVSLKHSDDSVRCIWLDHNKIISGSQDGTIKFWHRESVFSHETHSVSAIVSSPSSFPSSSRFDLSSGNEVSRLTGYKFRHLQRHGTLPIRQLCCDEESLFVSTNHSIIHQYSFNSFKTNVS